MPSSAHRETRSIPAIFREQAVKFQSRPMVYSKVQGHWSPLTWAQVRERVDFAAAGLLVLGVRHGDCVSLLSENRPEWLLADLAVLSAGAADAPIYATNTPAECAYVVHDSRSRVCFVSTQEQLDKLLRTRAEMPGLTHVVTFEDGLRGGAEGLTVLSFAQLEALGREKGDRAAVDARVAALGRDDLLTLIYTSGTTGEPKGVMLTHGNMIANCEACQRALPINTDDSLVSFLPLSHSFERMAGYYLALMYAGATVYYAESIAKLVENIGDVKPTVVTSVPRIYEKIYAGFMANRDNARGAKRALMDWAIGVGRDVSRLRQAGRQPGALLSAQYALATKLVFSKLAAKVGGRIRFFVSGGAPLSRDIAEFFHAAGLLVLEGYGLSETSPVLTVNRVEAYRFGTVGKAIDNVEIRIAPEDGEILARGPNIMKGYFGKPEASAEVLLADGWFATGDIGELDRDGFLKITDRKKDLFKTAGGKYVAPQGLENQLKLQKFIEQPCIVGDQRPYCIAVLVPRFENLLPWAHENGIVFKDQNELVAHPKVVELLQRDVDAVNATLARYEQIKYFLLLGEPFTQENGLLTPSMKVKRKAVMKHYAAQIDAIYAKNARPVE
jgi:long-chain acyl-CoA synthetase